MKPNLIEIIAGSISAFNDHSVTSGDVIMACLNPGQMPRAVFLCLQKRAESMAMQIANGTDCTEGFDDEHQEINRLLDEAPLIMHPDYGCVMAADVQALDENVSQVPDRAM